MNGSFIIKINLQKSLRNLPTLAFQRFLGEIIENYNRLLFKNPFKLQTDFVRSKYKGHKKKLSPAF